MEINEELLWFLYLYCVFAVVLLFNIEFEILFLGKGSLDVSSLNYVHRIDLLSYMLTNPGYKLA